MVTWLPFFGSYVPAQPRESQKAIEALFSVLLHQPVFDLESWNTLEMAYIPRHDCIPPDQGGRANEYIFHANQLAATCQMGKNVPRDDCLVDAKIEDSHPGQHLVSDPLPKDRVILTPAAPMAQFHHTHARGEKHFRWMAP